MSDDPRTEPLLRWNELARENAENAMISTMLEHTANSSEPIDKYSSWLLVGSAAIAAFFITNADRLIPLISQRGFLLAGGFLSLSCLFGFLSKGAALSCQIAIASGEAGKRVFVEHFARHEAEERKIQEHAEFWGITLQTGIRMDRVLNTYLSFAPWLIRLHAKRYIKSYGDSPFVGAIPRVNRFASQVRFSVLQAISFVFFLATGMIGAALA